MSAYVVLRFKRKLTSICTRHHTKTTLTYCNNNT